jgi:acetyltransferase-like isoleucine patch superfamily enzyme
MRKDHRPYWVKKIAVGFQLWYSNHFVRPACESLGDHHNLMRPWCVHVSGPNIHIGEYVTMVAEASAPIHLVVWGRKANTGQLKIGDYGLICPGVRISVSDEVVIGEGVMIANGVYITDSDWHDIYDRTQRSEKITPVRIADNVWLGDRCSVLKGVSIGENSIVAASAVVTKDVPANVVVAGNPAKVVKMLDPLKEMRTRADFFSDPEILETFFQRVDQERLSKNSLLHWLRTILIPSSSD